MLKMNSIKRIALYFPFGYRTKKLDMYIYYVKLSKENNALILWLRGFFKFDLSI